MIIKCFLLLCSPVGGKSVSSPSHSAKGEREVKSPHPSIDKDRPDHEDAPTPVSSTGPSRADRLTRPRYVNNLL